MTDSIPLNDEQFKLSEHHSLIFEQANKFARNELYPIAAKMDADEWWPEDIFGRIGSAGFCGITISEKFGGQGLDVLSSGLIAQAMGRWNYALALSWIAHENLCLDNLFRNCSEDQKLKYLPALCAGEQIGALGLTEPGAGSDALGAMSTSAVRRGDVFVLNGRKMYITNGPVADLVLVYAKTNKDLGKNGISAFIVEKNFPGFKVAQKLVKMGFRGSQTGELVFDNCEVPVENLVGNMNEGVGVVMSGLDFERAVIAPICVGMAERALQLSLEHAANRSQFGRQISGFQMIQSKIADMYAGLEAMKALNLKVLSQINTASNDDAGRGMIHADAAASIMFCANTLNFILDNAVQIHGGSGYIWESEVNRLYRGNKLLEIGAGTTEIRRLIISQELIEKGNIL